MDTVIVAVTGATGTIISTTLLRKLKQKRVKAALIVSEAAYKVAEIELKIKPNELADMADIVIVEEHQIDEIESKSMVIAPCSMKTLAGVAWGRLDNLVLKAARKMLEKRYPLILVVREAPWSIIHLRNMLEASRRGAIVMPPIIQPRRDQETLEDFADDLADRIVNLCI